MKVSNPNSTNSTGNEGNSITLGKDDNPESLKKTLQDPNTSMPDTMQTLAKLFQLDGKKVAAGDASEEEMNRYKLNEGLRQGNLSDSERDQFASLLGMSPERMAEVQKQFGIGRGENTGDGLGNSKI